MGVLEPIYLYATWPDAVYACINKKEACAPEEIRKKSICVEADIGAVLEKLYDRKNSQGDVAVPEEIPPKRYAKILDNILYKNK